MHVEEPDIEANREDDDGGDYDDDDGDDGYIYETVGWKRMPIGKAVRLVTFHRMAAL